MKNGVYINDPDKPSLEALDFLYSEKSKESEESKGESTEKSDEKSRYKKFC